MKILAFDTSTAACIAALDNDGEVQIRRSVGPREDRLDLPERIDRMMRDAGLGFADLDAVAYGRGPGAFIGVRIAVALAQAVACALSRDRMLVAVSSLAAVAQTAFEQCDAARVLSLLDAGRGECYYGCYERGEEDTATLQGEEGVAALERIPGICDFEGAYRGFGFKDRLDKLASQPPKPDDLDDQTLPSGEAMLALARREIKLGNWVAPSEATPVYLRDEIV